MATKLNVNIRTLLSNCEILVKSEENYWRLQKYIKSLDTMIAELMAMEDPQSTLKVPSYKERILVLKLATGYIDNEAAADRVAANGMELGQHSLKEIQQVQNSQQYNDLRKDLLAENDTLRRRRVPDDAKSATNNASATSDNMNEAVKYYNNAQEKITEHMLSLTRNLKEQTETANRIIRRDTEMVSQSTGMTDRNINSLGKEAEKLEQQSRKAYKWWLWLMIVFVIVVFIGMVLFMKIMKKRKA